MRLRGRESEVEPISEKIGKVHQLSAVQNEGTKSLRRLVSAKRECTIERLAAIDHNGSS
jgi:hypothetical protein